MHCQSRHNDCYCRGQFNPSIHLILIFVRGLPLVLPWTATLIIYFLILSDLYSPLFPSSICASLSCITFSICSQSHHLSTNILFPPPSPKFHLLITPIFSQLLSSHNIPPIYFPILTYPPPSPYNPNPNLPTPFSSPPLIFFHSFMELSIVLLIAIFLEAAGHHIVLFGAN